ncbi:hypothetical protein DPM19_10960 [Actinomadura craniellae]|uniref:Helix-hairpin-helix domain-containing protein n=2 Tax=Actinomadura craniellae TaxID=2231787 RepID=A0A365H8L7_9ACTN|nr:hypothetical protein DPM19_10960 [Actinomadura craniellae]
MMFGGSLHAYVIRRRVFFHPVPSPSVGSPSPKDTTALRRPPPHLVPAPAEPSSLQVAAEQARRRLDARAEARALAASDPALARELGIGRPDLPRGYDDGGLVDVNHCPPEVLATLPGLTPELVERVVRAREECGGFVSVEELSVLAELPPRLTPRLAEQTIYLS